MTGRPDTSDARQAFSEAVETGGLLRRALAAVRAARADPVGAAPEAERLVGLARRAQEPEALVVALRAEAWSARARLDVDRARRRLDAAARLAAREGLTERLGEVLGDRAAVAMELGRPRAALRDLSRARPLLGRTTSSDLDHLGAVLAQNAGRLDDAARIYRRLLADRRGPAGLRVRVANNLAMIESQLGHHGEAVRLIGEARDIAAEAGPAFAAYVAVSQAWVLAHAGRLPESIRVFAEAEEAFADADLPAGELHAEYADVMLDLRLLPEAQEAAEQAREEFARAGLPLMRAEAQLRVARVARLAGRSREAEQEAGEAAASFRRQRRAGWAALCVVVEVSARLDRGETSPDDLWSIRRAASVLARLGMPGDAVEAHLYAGQLAIGLGRRSQALASFDAARRLAGRGPVVVRLRGRVAAASAAALRGDRASTLRHCRDGLADLERHRAGLGSQELRARASAHGSELGRIGVATVLESSGPIRVLRWLERTRAAALTGAGPRSTAGPSVSGASTSHELAALHTLQERVDRGDAEDVLTERSRAELENRLRRASWEQEASGPRHGGHEIAELRDRLGDRVLVELGVSGGAVVAVCVDGRRAWIAPLAPLDQVRAEVERLTFSMRSLSYRLSDRTTRPHVTSIRERVRRLHEQLIRPLGLSGQRELVVVPVGLLSRVPWCAMHDAPVSLSPSAAFWAITHDRSRSDPDAAAGPGPPESASTLVVAGPGLPGAVEEADRVAGCYRDALWLAPPDSTVDAVAAALPRVRTAHLACHGRVRTDNPVFSGLQLSDGDLTVHELIVRRLAAHRVVLAACEVGDDVALDGGESIGFVSALIAQGTAGILGTFQVAPDVATAGLMPRVHRSLATGTTLAEALYAARDGLDLDDPSDLVTWCGFTVFGAA